MFTYSVQSCFVAHGPGPDPAASTVLHERKKERSQRRVSTHMYTGTEYTRVFDCPKGQISTILGADLADGVVMGLSWGGVSTTNAQDPRLQTVDRIQQPRGGQDQLRARFLQLDVTGTADGTYIEIDRTRRTSERTGRDVTRTIGVAKTSTDSGIPDAGDTLDAATAGLVTTPRCEQMRIDPHWQHGRVLVVADWVALQDNIALE